MYRVAKEQIGLFLGFEIVAACMAVSLAVLNKALGHFWPAFFKMSFLSAWLWSFIGLSAIVVLLIVWGFVLKVKDLKELAQEFGASFGDMAEAIYEHGFRKVIGDSFGEPKESFRIWLKEKRDTIMFFKIL